MVRAICGVQLKDWKRSTDLLLSLNETIDQLAMADSVCWYGYVLRRVRGHVLRRALDFEVEGQRKNGRPKRTWKKQVEEESVKVDLRREDVPCWSKWSVGVDQIAVGLRWIWPPSLVGDATRLWTSVSNSQTVQVISLLATIQCVLSQWSLLLLLCYRPWLQTQPVFISFFYVFLVFCWILQLTHNYLHWTGTMMNWYLWIAFDNFQFSMSSN